MKRVYIPYILIGLVVFAFLFSMFYMMPQSIGLDESQTLWQAEHTFTGIFYVVGQDVHVPLYHIMLHYWLMLFGSSVTVARLLSLIFYLVTIPLVYYLGKIAFNESLSIFATILFTISPFTNWYGSIIRMYSLLTLVTVASQIFFILLFKGKPEHRKAYWFGYFFSCLLGIYTHYFFLLMLGVDGLFYIAYHKIFPKHSLRNFVMITLILAALFVPWLYYVHTLGGFGANTTPKLTAPSTVDVFNTFSNFLFGFQADPLNTAILSAWPLLTLLLFFALQKNQKVSPEGVYFTAAAIVPIVLAAALSHVIEPFYLSRYFIGFFPSFCLAVAWFFSFYPQSAATVGKFALAGFMVVMLQIQTVNPQASVKEDYSQVASYVSANASSRDIVAVSAPFTVYPFEYYYTGSATLTTLPVWDQLVSGPIPAFTTSTLAANVGTFGNYQKLYLILSYNQGYESDLQMYFETHYQRLYEQNFSPDLTLYVYQLNYNNTTLADMQTIVNSYAVSGGAGAAGTPSTEQASSTSSATLSVVNYQ
ncbi:MAG TPA: glycosyltransferase family 39 protein [Candidatus Paceibacterota bacterium]|nr:glycosyltransferase family 39 protein [Candidatus Paceibacterota bacterium]